MTFYQWAIDSSPEAIFCIDSNGCFLNFNKTAERLYGLISARVMGKSFNLFLDNYVITNEQQKTEFPNLFQNVLNGGAVSNLKMNCLNKEFKIIPTLACAYPIFDNENSIVGMSITLKNAIDFEKTDSTYIKHDQDLESFFHIACHDIQSSLRTINFLTHIMTEQLKELCHTKTDIYLTKINKNIYKLANLIDSMFYYLRFFSQNNEIEAIDCHKLVEDVIKFLDKPKNCVFELDQSLSIISTSKHSLQQVFRSIIGNVINSHNTIETVYIVIKQKDYEKKHVFSIQGKKKQVSITKERKEKSQPHYGSGDMAGYGINLTVAKKIIENQGGNITIEHNQDLGDSFIFTWKKK